MAVNVLELIIGIALVWLLDVLVRPYAKCPACGGSKVHGLSGRHVFGSCWLCGGKGYRLRFGARMVRRAARRKEP